MAGFLKDDGITIGVFHAEESESVGREPGRLGIQAPADKLLVGGVDVGAPNIEACARMSRDRGAAMVTIRSCNA